MSNFDTRWFQNAGAKDDLGEYYINERAVRARAGILLTIALFLLFTRLDHGHHNEFVLMDQFMHGAMKHNSMDHSSMGHGSMSMTASEDQSSPMMVEVVPREYYHGHVLVLLLFVIYEMLMPMFRETAKFSVTARIGLWLTRKQTPLYVPMRPKVLTWIIGGTMASTCFSLTVAMLTIGFMSNLGLVLLVLCAGFMWLEATSNICAACILYNWLSKIGVVREVCPTCTISVSK